MLLKAGAVFAGDLTPDNAGLWPCSHCPSPKSRKPYKPTTTNPEGIWPHQSALATRQDRVAYDRLCECRAVLPDFVASVRR